MKIVTLAEAHEKNKKIDFLFWVGCAGSFDNRAKKITKSFANILQNTGLSFVILGKEENCTGDPAKRAGNEFLFQKQALKNIELLNSYKIKKIVTTCPHCFNTLKNEYPELGGNYEVIDHTTFLDSLLKKGEIKISNNKFKNKRITFHDPCYLGRANKVYNAPRNIIKELKANLVEMKKCKKNALCCGAGGAQLFKESEKGKKEINIKRVEQALDTKPDVIATGCPFCNIMLNDGIKSKEKSIPILDITEIIE